MTTWFRGELDFLSNFYLTEVPFNYKGKLYVMPSSENAFQAMKVFAAELLEEEAKLAWLDKMVKATPSGSKRLGRTIKINPSKWNNMSTSSMESVLRAKFLLHPELMERLKGTGNLELVENNTWGDRIWGKVDGVGENRLGILLMKIRDDFN